ncbi:MAG: flavin reductase family protein [Firmicutes bacterium]|nr:flavin reductase family protein [Bacillota bacterium]
MSKQIWKPGTILYPVPVVMVSCGDMEHSNIITVAWTGTVNTDPAMTYISVRPSRYSYDIIKNTGEFVINVTTEELARATDWCGVRSGRDFDKFKEMHLTKEKAAHLNCPVIGESPINIECKVKDIIHLGTHDMFLGEVVGCMADTAFMDESGKFDFAASKPICYSHGEYYGLGKYFGKFGWTVAKKRKQKKENKKK